MTTIQQPWAGDTAAPDATQPEAAAATQGGFAKRLLIIVLLVLLLIAGTYAFGWWNAYRLSHRFLADAHTSYEEGNYLVALTGREAYDAEALQYVRTGGYIDVERIWSHRYSWPTPDLVEEAEQRSHEIIYQRLTAQQAEQYIQANIGRSSPPYFGEIYLHLGDLYLREGDEMAAREIYESVPELFPRRALLIEAAMERLEQLED
jgi:hypothetical protein